MFDSALCVNAAAPSAARHDPSDDPPPVVVNPPVEEAPDRPSDRGMGLYNRIAASPFNRRVLALVAQAQTLQRTVLALLEEFDGADPAPWAEFSETRAQDAQNVIYDVRGFEWALDVFISVGDSHSYGPLPHEEEGGDR
jgi:hypothetical protein